MIQQKRLLAFMLKANAEVERDVARYTAREYYDLGHCEHLVKGLVATMRRANQTIVRYNRELRRLELS